VPDHGGGDLNSIKRLSIEILCSAHLLPLVEGFLVHGRVARWDCYVASMHMVCACLDLSPMYTARRRFGVGQLLCCRLVKPSTAQRNGVLWIPGFVKKTHLRFKACIHVATRQSSIPTDTPLELLEQIQRKCVRHSHISIFIRVQNVARIEDRV
jgi:hypothetical protein